MKTVKYFYVSNPYGDWSEVIEREITVSFETDSDDHAHELAERAIGNTVTLQNAIPGTLQIVVI